MEKCKTILNFTNRIANELIPKFLEEGTRSATYTITTFYQMDISNELRLALFQLLKLGIELEELEEAINKVCPSDLMIHVRFMSSEQLILQILKMPKCKIMENGI